MRVIAPDTVVVRRTAPRLRSLDIESAGVALALVVVLFGLWLVYAARVARLDEGAPSSDTVLLTAVTSASQLEPALSSQVSAYERAFVAQQLFAHLRSSAASKLNHVGQLAEVTVPAGAIRADPRLETLNARLAARPEARLLPLLSRGDLVAVKPRFTVRTAEQFRSHLLRAILLFAGAFLGAHLWRRGRRRDDDPIVLPVLLLLSGIGLITMCALRDPLRDTLAAETFSSGVALGLVLLVAASEVDFEASALRRAVVLPLAAAIALAATLLVFGSGPGTSGVKVNLLGAQPVEVIRLLIVFALAAYFGRRVELLRELSEPSTDTRPWLRYVRLPRWQDVRPLLASMGLVLTFFFLQKDLGPALVLTCVFLGLFGIARGRIGLVLAGLALLLAGFTIAYYAGFPATVRNRVMIWASPWNNGVAGGNHVAQGLWAVATGGPWGSGAGLGSPGAIPEGHTDFVIAAIGEELGWAGVALVGVLFGLLCWRCLRAALRAPGDFSTFLAAGVLLVIAVQALVISGGLLGLIPLSGVVTPFLSYGRSSMLMNCAALGIVLAVARRRGAERAHMRRPIRMLAATLATAGAVVLGRAAWVQVVHADEIAAASSLSEQGDGGYRFEYNPRLLAVARGLARGSIYDRNGLPLATSRPDEIAGASVAYESAGGIAPSDCDATSPRCYPLGGFAFHLVGDWTHQANWAARNSSYFERESDAILKGYDDHSTLVDVVNPRTGIHDQALRRDFSALLPLVRDRYRSPTAAVQAIHDRNRDLTTSIDARLQVKVAAALRDGISRGGFARGAAVVLDAATGEVLAAASYPWPADSALAQASVEATSSDDQAAWLDRARYGLYPPGSTFKLLVAGAALRGHEDSKHFVCVRLPDGRVGNYVHGSARPVRDDPMDTTPHGEVDLDRGLIVSCNAYFAQLALTVGPKAILDAASLFQMSVSRAQTPESLRGFLPQVGYGQGEALVTPLKLARLSAAIANHGLIVPVRWSVAAKEDQISQVHFVTPPDAERLTRAMRAVVTTGTGRSLRDSTVAIAGKTGTAEVSGAPAHSWFTGFAPYGGGGRRIAFAVIVENGGYGGRAAAPIAGRIASAARELGLIK